MLNVKTLTDTMSRMQLPELQQYAALHKNDPYVVTLALSIANQKKQMLASKAGQAGMMPQSTVVDRDIMGIPLEPQPRGAVPQQQMAAAPQQQALPEDQGIGQLPAQNIQGMAEGGIVAFGPGGSTGEEDIPNWLKAFPPESGIRRAYGAIKQYDKNNPMPTAQDIYLNNLKNNPSNKLPAGTNFTQPNLPSAQTNSNVPDVESVGTTPAVVNPPAVKPTVVNPSPTDSGGISNLPVSKLTTPALNTKPMTAADAVAASQQFGSGSELIAGVNQLRADALKTNKDVETAYKEGLAALPKPGEEAEARLRKREAEDAISQADAKGMAIFKAGLGMLAGTSPNAFENIGKGAMVGLEDYSASIKEFRKLGMERDKAYADIEAARNAAARDDFKTSTALRERAADRLAKVDEKGIDVTATLFKTNKETASTIYRDSFDQAQQNARTMATEAGATNRALIQERGANARAQMGSPLNLYAQLGAAPEGSPLLKGYNIAKNEGQMERLFESYNKLANDPLNGTYFKAQHPTFESYVRTYQSGIGVGGNGGFTQPPANATVLKPK